jgi:hypothetical protein
MLFVPSPSTLVHSGPRRPSYEISLQSELQTSFASAPPTSSNVGSPYSSYSTEILCFLGSLALRDSLPDMAFFFYEEAASRGSIEAMNAIFLVFYGFSNLMDVPNGPLFQRAMVWNLRALDGHSVEARRNRAQYLFRQQNFGQSLAYYTFHYQETSSILTLMDLAMTKAMRSPIPDIPTSLNLLRHCIANGHASAISGLITLLNLTRGNFAFWRHFFESLPPTFAPTPILKAHLKSDLSTIPFQLVSAFVLKVNKPFTDPAPGLCWQSSIGHGIPLLQLKVDNRDHEDLIRSAPFPTASPTVELIQLFELCCPEFASRNLGLAELLLFHLYQSKPLGVLESRFWQGKVRSKKARDLIQCGFIACMLGDFEFAAACFS